MLPFRPRPQIDPDEYLRSHPVLTQSDLSTAAQVGQLPGTEDEIPAFTLDEAESMLPGTAPDAPTAPRLPGWDDVRGGMSRAVSGLTGGLRGLGDMARQAAPIDPWQGAPALPGTAPDAPEQVQAAAPQALTPPAAPSAPAASSAPAQAAPMQGSAPASSPVAAPAMGLPGTAPDQPGQYQPLPNPFAQTDADRKALEDAEKRDNRLRIASGIMRGLGFLTQFGAGLAGNNPLGNAAGAASVGFNPQIDGAEQVRRRIAERQVNDYRAQQFEQSQRDNALRAASEQQQFALRARMAQSTEQLNQARAEQERLRTQQMQSEWDQLRGNREAAVGWLRSLASQYPGAPLSREIMEGTEPNGRLWGASADQLDTYARQFATLGSSGQIAGRAAIGRAPGGGGGGPALPGPGGGPPVDTSLDARVRRYLELQGVNLDSTEGQLAYTTALERAHGDSTESRAFRASMDDAFSSVASGGEVYPAGVDAATYTRIANAAAAARQQVQPFVTAIRSLDSAMQAGLDTAGWQAIRNGGGAASRVAEHYNLPDLRGIIDNATDALGRIRSGGAITEDEEARFIRILSNDSIWNSPSQLRNALHRLNSEVAAAVRSRFDAAGAGYWDLYQRRTSRRRR